MSDVFSLIEDEVFVSVTETSTLTDVLPLILQIPLMMFMFGSFPFEVLSSVMKYAICSSMMGTLIFMGMTPFCLGGILSTDLIVAF